MTRAALSVPADVYHAHDLNTLGPALTAAAAHAARTVYDSHELYPDLTGFGRGERTRWHRLERRLIGRADACIAPSLSVAQEIAGRYDIMEPLVLMNCPEAPQPFVVEGTPLTRFRRADETLLVYAGAYSPNRGIENVVRAANHLGDCRLAMMGWGPLEPDLRAMAGERVVFVDPVEPDAVVAALGGADIGVVPCLPIGRNNELAAPNKLFEYVNAGLAVAGSDLPEIKRVVLDHDLGGVFDASDPRSIARCITELIPDIDRLRQHAREAAALYTWEGQEPVLLGLYEGLERARSR